MEEVLIKFYNINNETDNMSYVKIKQLKIFLKNIMKIKIFITYYECNNLY